MSKNSTSLSWETQVGFPSLRVAGVDEVGRGCLAGPVVAAAVILPESILSQAWIRKVTDSKKLTPLVREELFPLIQEVAIDWSLGQASVEEIDQINIYHATHLAMKRAIESLKTGTPDHILVDGNRLPTGLTAPATAIVGGDALSLSIACASILAKVSRDRQMSDYETTHPGYGFATHKGYGTPEHLSALRNQGPCLLHRRTFAPVKALISASNSLFG